MDLTIPIAVATTALNAAKSGGFDIAKALGIRPKGSNDTGYVAAVAKDMAAEYDAAQSAVNSTSDPAIQQRIVSAYNSEKAAWGDPNNPNRNVAIGQGRFAAQISSIMASAPKATTTIPQATGNGGGVTVIAPNSQADTTATGTSAAINPAQQQPQNPLLNYMPVMIFGGAIVLIAIILLKKKGK